MPLRWNDWPETMQYSSPDGRKAIGNAFRKRAATLREEQAASSSQTNSNADAGTEFGTELIHDVKPDNGTGQNKKLSMETSIRSNSKNSTKHAGTEHNSEHMQSADENLMPYIKKLCADVQKASSEQNGWHNQYADDAESMDEADVYEHLADMIDPVTCTEIIHTQYMRQAPRCIMCQNELPRLPSMRYCPWCGARIENSDEAKKRYTSLDYLHYLTDKHSI